MITSFQKDWLTILFYQLSKICNPCLFVFLGIIFLCGQLCLSLSVSDFKLEFIDALAWQEEIHLNMSCKSSPTFKRLQYCMWSKKAHTCTTYFLIQDFILKWKMIQEYVLKSFTSVVLQFTKTAVNFPRTLFWNTCVLWFL